MENADTTHSWRVVSPGDLRPLSFDPERVTSGQNTGFTLWVKNRGQAHVYLLPDSTILNIGQQINVPMPDTVLAAGSQPDSLPVTFPVTTFSIPHGDYPVTLQLRQYRENRAFYSDTLTFSGTVRVDSLVSLHLVNANSPDTVSQDMRLSIVVDYKTGPNSAPVRIDSIKIPTLNYDSLANFTIGPGPTHSDTLRPFIDTTLAGIQNPVAVYHWTDTNTGDTGQTSFPLGQMTILGRAELRILDITGPDTVIAGQQNQELVILVRNAGESVAVLDSLRLTRQIGIYQDTLLTPLIPIPGNSVDSLRISLDISPNTATGTEHFGAVISYHDSLNSKPRVASGSNLHSWTIFRPAGAEIVAVTSPHSTVSRGQDSIAVRVRLRNNGDSGIEVDSLDLYSRNFAPGDYQFLKRFALPFILPAEGDMFLHFETAVSPNAPAAWDRIDARLSGKNLVSQTPVRIDSSNAPHSWGVQRRPDLRVSMQLGQDTVSAGQDFVAMNISVLNRAAGKPTAIALIKSISIALNDSFNHPEFVIQPPDSFDTVLLPDERSEYHFQIRSLPSTNPGTYLLMTHVSYRDSNDQELFTDTTGILETLVVQRPAVITADFGANNQALNRDKTHWGNPHDTLVVFIENTGEATATVSGDSIASYPQVPVTLNRVSPVFPLKLRGSQRDSIVYHVNYSDIPDSNAEVRFRAFLSGRDANSDSMVTAQTDTSAPVEILTPPNLNFVTNSLMPNPVEDSLTNQRFRLKIDNSGASPLNLNPAATRFRILSSPVIETMLDNGLVILPQDSVQLRFSPVNLTLPQGSYPTRLVINGEVHDDSMNTTLTGDRLHVGGGLFITNLVYFQGHNPGEVPDILQGTDSLNLFVQVSNTTADTLVIDSTDLRFFHNGAEILIPERRTDSNTIIPARSQVLLNFEFDLGLNLEAGAYSISGLVTATNAQVTLSTTQDDIAQFNILSNAELAYLDASLQPDSAIAGQTVTFSTALFDTGLAAVTLDGAQSFLTLHRGTDSLTTVLSTNYFIPGDTTDTVTVIFKPVHIPAGLDTGKYDLKLSVNGNLQTGDPYGRIITAPGQFTILDTADVFANSMDIGRDSVVAGQGNIPVEIELKNTGQSVGEVTAVRLMFQDTTGQDVSSQWTVGGLGNFPVRLKPDSITTFSSTLSLASQATQGPIRTRVVAIYRDVLMPEQTLRDTSVVLDSVLVVRPGVVQISTTLLDSASIPRPPHVNLGQSFSIRSRVENMGQEPLTGIRVSLLRAGSILGTIQNLNLGPDTSRVLVFQTNASLPTGVAIFSVRIDSALSQFTGNPVQIAPPQDATASLNIQSPAQLQVTVETLDSVHVGQQFTVTALAENMGQAPVDTSGTLQIDPGIFTLVNNDSTKQFIPGSPVSWEVEAPAQTTLDSMTVRFDTIPKDLNIDSAAALINEQDTAAVRVLHLGDFTIQTLYFNENPQDTSIVVSTSQENIPLRVRVNQNPFYPDSQRATLLLPDGAGFSTTNNLIRPIGSAGTVLWFLNAPDSATQTFQTIRVAVSARSGIGNLIARDTAEVTIRVVTRATLTLNAGIVNPPGARDDTVSYGQSFTYQTVVQNTGEVGVTGAAWLKLQVPNDTLLYILDNNSVQTKLLRKPFTVGQAVNWSVKVGQNSQAAKILSKIRNLQARKHQLNQPKSGDGNALTAISAGSRLALSEVEIDRQVNHLRNQLNSLVSTSKVTATIDTIPKDSLSNKTALVARRRVETPIVIQEEAQITVDTIMVPQKVSTGQQFTVHTLVTASEQVSNQKTAILRIPAFQYNSSMSFTGNSASWQVTAPDSIAGAFSVPLEITIRSTDQNSGDSLVSSPRSSSFILERRAVLSLNARLKGRSPDATGHILSFRQDFTLIAEVRKKGDASVIGTGKLKLQLNPQDSIRLAAGEELIKNFSYPDSVTWDLRTPSRLISSNLKVSFTQLPLDENTGQPAFLDPDSNVATLAIATEIRQLRIKRADLEKVFNRKFENINRQGTQNYPLIGFFFQNQKVSDDDPTISVDSLTLSFRDQENQLLPAPHLSVHRLVIANPAYYRASLSKKFGKTNATPKVFAEYILDENMPNPMPISFDEVLNVSPGAGYSDSMIIYLDISQNSPNKSFRLQIENIYAYHGPQESFIQVVDENGNLFDPQNAAGISDIMTVVSADEEKIFGNYPNPFGETEAFTRFVFWMENNGSAEIHIYTLMGGLVYSDQAKNLLGGQLYDGRLKWDGKNNADHRVLNGVYIAILNIRYDNGQTRSFKTKVAYIK